MNIKPSTAAATAGGTVATALVVILEWLLTFWHISLPASVGAALATLFAAAGAFFAPRSPPTTEQITEIQQQVLDTGYRPTNPTTPL